MAVRVFSPPESRDIASSFLPGRLGVDLDARLEDVRGIDEPELAPAPAEEPAEHVVEILLDLVVGVEEEGGALVANLVGYALEVASSPSRGRRAGPRGSRSAP